MSLLRLCLGILVVHASAELSDSPCVSFDTNKVYHITSRYSGKALTVVGGQTENGASVVQNSLGSSASYDWKFTPATNGVSANTYSIINAKSGKALNVYNASAADGANLVIWPVGGSAHDNFCLRPLVNGLYSITAEHSGKVVSISNGSKDNGGNIIQRGFDGQSEDQRWEVTLHDESPPSQCASFDTNKVYHITSRYSNKALTVVNGQTESGANIVQDNLGNSTAYDWKFAPATNSYNQNMYSIINVKSSKALNVYGASTADGANLVIWPVEERAHDNFCLRLLGNGFYSIRAQHSGKAVSISDGSSNSGGNIVQWGFAEHAEDQQWTVTLDHESPAAPCASFDTNKVYHIASRYSSKALTVDNGQTENGTDVVQNDLEGSTACDWKFSAVANGISANTYAIINLYSGKALNVFGESTSNGANLVIWTNGGGTNDNFCLRPLQNGFYSITAQHSGKSVTVDESGDIIQWDFHHQLVHQQWAITLEGESQAPSTISPTGPTQLPTPSASSLPPGTQTNSPSQAPTTKLNNSPCVSFDTNKLYHITSRYSSKALTVAGGQTENGASVVQNDIGSSTVYDWKFAAGTYSRNMYSIINVKSGKALNVYGARTDDGTNLVIWTDGEEAHNKFCLRLLGNGSYSITAQHSNKAVSISDGSRYNGGSIVQRGFDEQSEDQQWAVTVHDETSAQCASFNTNKVYHITSRFSNKALTVVYGQTENGANVVQNDLGSSTAYDWKFAPAATNGGNENAYSIINVKSGKALNVYGASKVDGANLVIWPVGGGAHDNFCLRHLENGFYSIIAQHSGKAVSISDGSRDRGGNIVQWGFVEQSEDQQWAVTVDDESPAAPCASFDTDKVYHITSRYSNKALTVANGQTENGADVVQNDLGSSTAYDWQFTPISNGISANTYSIINVNSDKALNVSGESTSNGANLIIWPNGGGTNDNFCLRPLENGFYSITAQHSGKSVTVDESGDIVQWDFHHQRVHQQWSVTFGGESQAPSTTSPTGRTQLPTPSPTSLPTGTQTNSPSQATTTTTQAPTGTPYGAPSSSISQTPSIAQDFTSFPTPSSTASLPRFLDNVGFRILSHKLVCSPAESSAIQPILDLVIGGSRRRELRYVSKGLCSLLCIPFPEGMCYTLFASCVGFRRELERVPVVRRRSTVDTRALADSSFLPPEECAIYKPFAIHMIGQVLPAMGLSAGCNESILNAAIDCI